MIVNYSLVYYLKYNNASYTMYELLLGVTGQ